MFLKFLNIRVLASAIRSRSAITDLQKYKKNQKNKEKTKKHRLEQKKKLVINTLRHPQNLLDGIVFSECAAEQVIVV